MSRRVLRPRFVLRCLPPPAQVRTRLKASTLAASWRRRLRVWQVARARHGRPTSATSQVTRRGPITSRPPVTLPGMSVTQQQRSATQERAP